MCIAGSVTCEGNNRFGATAGALPVANRELKIICNVRRGNTI